MARGFTGSLQGHSIDINGSDVGFLRDSSIEAEEEVVYLPYGPTINSAKAPSGTIVEFGKCVEFYDGDFFLVKSLVQTAGNEILMRGVRLQRTCRCDDMLPKKLNEVAMILRADSHGNTDPKVDQCLVTMPITLVMCERKLILTNFRFPQASFRELVRDYYNEDSQYLKVKALETGPLVCRWKWITFYDYVNKKVTMEELVQLRQSECDASASMPDVLIAKQLRRGPSTTTYKSVAMPGKGKKRLWKENEIDLTCEDEDAQIYDRIETSSTRKVKSARQSLSVVSERCKFAPSSILSHFTSTKPTQRQQANAFDRSRYTYGDICAGAGGMASGAKQAGLRARFLLDHWSDACQTLRLNFPDSKVMEKDIHDFCTNPRRSYQVDVLHVSFPCQPHSPVHTRPGSRDEANVATGYSVLPIFDICKPRIATFEQTPGIRTHRGGGHFRALVQQITAAGYSVAWRNLNFAESGNPQARSRLIIIAAGPGEKLPPFPQPTHGLRRGLQPYTTIWDVLQLVPARDEPHMLQSTEKQGAPYSPHQPLKRVITCSGGDDDLHPKGTRSFTVRELALLQTFPATHRFFGTKTSMRKQIGNAVPSCFGKALFESITQSLRETDRENAAYKPETIEID